MIRNIIIKCGLIIVLVIGVIFCIEYVKDNPKVILGSVSLDERSIESSKPLPREGERLSYLIKYLWIVPVGVVDIEVGKKESYKNHAVYPLVARGTTPKFISSFIKAEGKIKSYIDVSKLYPWRYEEIAQAEGHNPSNKVILYNQDAQIMEFENIKRKIPKNTQDPLSALFYLRWQEYEGKEEIMLNVNSNQENYTLLSKLKRKSSVDVNGKRVNMLVTDSFIKSPKRYSKSEAKITSFIMNDADRIPLLLKVRTKFGPLVIRLIDVEYK